MDDNTDKQDTQQIEAEEPSNNWGIEGNRSERDTIDGAEHLSPSLKSVLKQAKGSAFSTLENIPDPLKERRQWMMWRFEHPTGRKKPTKVPYQTNGQKGKSNEQATWNTFEACCAALKKGGFDGIGFAFAKGDGLTGIDVDHCIDANGEPEPWVNDILAQFSNTYIEVSPSGNGLHIFCFGSLATTWTRKWKKPGTDFQQGIEVYDYRSPRYLTMTGLALTGVELADCQPGLVWLRDKHPPGSTSKGKHANTPELTADHATVLAALGYIPADGYKTWLEIGMALKTAGIGVEVWEQWSSKSAKYAPGECADKWTSFNGDGIGLGTLFHLAQQHGFCFPSAHMRLDDIGNAERLKKKFGRDIRWVSAFSKWLHWNGSHWQIDETEKVMVLAKAVARSIYEESANAKDKF